MERSLHDVKQDIKTRLIDGAKRRKSPLHTLIVGTADADLRVMVLREFDAKIHRLRFHTDRRSPKVAAIHGDPAMSVLAYDPAEKVQIRMRGIGRIATDGPDADAAWAACTPFAKRCYLAEQPPSDISAEPTSGLPAWVQGITPTEEQVAAARANFAILLVDIHEFDWLYLDNDGHRRAKVSFEDGVPEAAWTATWLVP